MAMSNNIISLVVKKIVIHTGEGEDLIYLELDMPTPFPELKDSGIAKITARKGYGVEWCRSNLHIEPEIISIK